MSGLNQHTRIYRKHKLIAGYDCGQDLSIIYALYHISGASVADMVVVCPLTGGFLNPRSVSLSHCVLRQDTSFRLASVSLPRGSYGYNVAHHCKCVNVCMNWVHD
ncbi:hypothetical protein ATANTOWER_018312 [Ataeniobius toweri]|uniref:Uncharacterized protein n=1 Tax=Ataeniobius toweri TaxID=208326 RepID=A0ABU7BJE0_9TELE|nr:hypothetical protein [Ataeniobius toweri]